jgi:peptidoglycan/xylan/chitin deacetylase (PgdA/CDA1 family)
MDDGVPRLLCGTPELPPHSVALTFDDGPGPRSAELARVLRDEGLPATFFVLGENVERYGSALDAYQDCGHVIGLHGDRHRSFRSAEHAVGELGRCAMRTSDYLGETAWFRPPYGAGDWPVPGFAGDVRAALGEVAPAVLRRIVTMPDDEIMVGPTGKVRKFLMRERLLAAADTP